jgi:phosphomannomutase
VSVRDLARFSSNFAGLAESRDFLVASDTRGSRNIIRKAVVGAFLATGARVADLGVASTPALFRESRVSGFPAIMITASHNEPPWNGLKFIVGGKGIQKSQLSEILSLTARRRKGYGEGVLLERRKAVYNQQVLDRFGRGSLSGLRVALDLGGGAASGHAPWILRAAGCNVWTVNDSPGVFERTIDPVADPLTALESLVKMNRCDLGLAFDCDGDRLVIMDGQGKKRSGDFMLTLALDELLTSATEKRVVVSVDTTQAVDELVEKHGGELARSKVGEANVVETMLTSGATLGGEGSSGGLIDGSFNYCRDSMIAALVILRAIRRRGRRALEQVKSYQQTRVTVVVPRAKAERAIARLQKRLENPDVTDGVKVRLSTKSWVLVRPSGTEDSVRVSAEAPTRAESEKIAKSYSRKLLELS